MKNLVICATAAYAAYCYYKYLHVISTSKIQKPWKKRRWWVKTINRNRTREYMDTQLGELLMEHNGEFENFTRMSMADFEYLLNKISPMISKDTSMRQAITPKIRLAITLRYLATGDSFKSLHYLFKVSSEIISRIVPEVCAALNQVLKDEIKGNR